MESNDKIYVVIGGEYSDWYIVGYSESLEEAVACCKKSTENLYVRDVYKIQGGTPPKKLWVKCVSRWVLDGGAPFFAWAAPVGADETCMFPPDQNPGSEKKNDNWNIEYRQDNTVFSSVSLPPHVVYFPSKNLPWRPYYNYYFWVLPENLDKLDKIAQDGFSEWRAHSSLDDVQIWGE